MVKNSHNPQEHVNSLQEKKSIGIYIDKGRSILRFFFRVSLICLVIFMNRSNSSVVQSRTMASLKCLKYNETAEKTRKAKITSSHTTKIATSTLQPERK